MCIQSSETVFLDLLSCTQRYRELNQRSYDRKANAHPIRPNSLDICLFYNNGTASQHPPGPR